MSVSEIGPGPEEIVTTSKDSELRAVSELFAEEGVGAVVVTDDDQPVGIVTDRDVALAVFRHDDVPSLPVTEVMTEDPATLRVDDDPIDISRAIDEHNVRRFPIVDEDGTLAGMVSLDDLVATIGEQLDNVADTIEVQSPSYSP